MIFRAKVDVFWAKADDQTKAYDPRKNNFKLKRTILGESRRSFSKADDPQYFQLEPKQTIFKRSLNDRSEPNQTILEYNKGYD